MKTTISFLTQDETKRLFSAIPSKRDRALFLTAYRRLSKHAGLMVMERTACCMFEYPR